MDSDSYSKQQLDDLFMDMIAYYDGDPKRIQHFTKVHSYARLIGIGEELDDASLFILEAAGLHTRYRHTCGGGEVWQVRWKASGAGGTDNRPKRCSHSLALRIT